MERDYQGNFKISTRDKICVGTFVSLIAVLTFVTVGAIAFGLESLL